MACSFVSLETGGKTPKASAQRKAEEAEKLARENAEIFARIKSTGAVTDNDITDDVTVAADGSVILGGGRDAAAAASAQRKADEAARLARENSDMRERIATTAARTVDDLS